VEEGEEEEEEAEENDKGVETVDLSFSLS